MKKIMPIIILLGLLLIPSTPYALDPQAGAKFKNAGMIQVQTPDPAKDQITLTHLKTRKVEPIKSGKLAVVPVGTYRLRVVMVDETYDGKVTVRRAERTDAIIGFGKLKVKGPRNALVQVFEKKQGKLMAEFPAGESQILPRGLYEVRVRMNGIESQRSDLLVVSSRTSELKIRS